MKKSLQFLDDGSAPSISVPPEKARVIILPVPLEKTVSYLPGTGSAPEKILLASRQVELYDPELAAYPYRIGIHTAPAIDCRGTPPAVLDRIRNRICSWVKKNQIPACLGGEHTLSLAPIQVLGERYPDLSVLHLDAHADLRDRYEGTKYSHACVMRRVNELDILVVAVGIRSVCEEEVHFFRQRGLPVFPAWEYGAADYPREKIIADLSGHVYVSVDLDAFDPSEVPAVGTPEPGGMRWNQVMELFRLLRDSGKSVVGFDLVELCPGHESAPSEYFAARLLYKMIGYFVAKGQ